MNPDSHIDLHWLRHEIGGVVGGLLTAADMNAACKEKNEALTKMITLCRTRLKDVLVRVGASIQATETKKIGEN